VKKKRLARRAIGVVKKEACSLRSTLERKFNGDDLLFMLTMILWTIDGLTGLNFNKIGEVEDLAVVLNVGIDRTRGVKEQQ